MIESSLITSSADQTFALGKSLALQLPAGSVVALYGQLGAGKTQFAKGVGAGLNLSPDNITSPTFLLCIHHDEGRLPFHHIDAYRMSGAPELNDLGWNDLRASEGIILIEWADKVEDILPAETIRIWMDHADSPDQRSIRIESQTELHLDQIS